MYRSRAGGVDKSFLAAKRENSILKHCSWPVRRFLFGFPLRSVEVCLTKIVWIMRSQRVCYGLYVACDCQLLWFLPI